MKRFWIGLGIGTLGGALLVLGTQYVLELGSDRLDLAYALSRQQVEEALQGARVLDIETTVSPESTATVTYVHEHLYDVHVTYQYQEKVKRITLPYGLVKAQFAFPYTLYRNSWVGLLRSSWVGVNTSDIVAMDRRALVIHDFTGSDSTHPEKAESTSPGDSLKAPPEK